MTDREAIERMEAETFALDVEIKKGADYLQETHDCMAIALAALQEKQVRDKGCEYCKELMPMYRTQISTRDKPAFRVFDPKFCPWCGRKLKTAMPGEETT